MRPVIRFAIGTTPLGAFAVAWGERGIVGCWMHARTPDEARSHIVRTFPNAAPATPPAEIRAAIDDVARLLDGEAPDLRTVELDMAAVPTFDRRVYEVARTIPPGTTMTYGAIAKALDEEPMRARDVGEALGRNPFAPIVPCHRVVAANGKLGGYSAPGGATTKRRLLEIEGAAVVAVTQPGLFDELSPAR
jgi:methylated-DNA-[protein]-cysteine S-methyltransferase